MRGGTNLTRQLCVLEQRHGVTLSAPRSVPLTHPPDHPSLILTGIASAPEIDRDRTRFSARCFGTLPTSLPLLIEHQHPAGTATLSYDALNNLRVRTSPLSGDARRYAAFSIGARILHYQIRNADSRNFHFEVTSAELAEISLTQYPHLDAARVLQRLRPSAQAEFYGLMARRVDLLSKMIPIIQKGFHP